MTQSSKLKKRILRERGIQLQKHTGKPLTMDDAPAPYKKSDLMRLVEIKYQDKLEQIIFKGTIYEVAKRIKVCPATVSNWRRIVSEAKDAEFWSSFEKEKQNEDDVTSTALP